MSILVHLLDEINENDFRYFCEQLSPGVQVSIGKDRATACEVLIAGRPNRELLSHNPNLKHLIIPFSGLPPVTREMVSDFPEISVHNIHFNAAPVAEMVITLMLAACKFVIPIDRSLRAHDWSPRYAPSSSLLLDRKRVLVLGYGAVGQRVARACMGLGMEVVATRRHASEVYEDGVATVYPATSLHELLSQVQVVLVCLPFTDETDGIIGEAELNLLPKEAVLVNVGRAQIVDEAALFTALKTQRLSGAGLDVWYHYPRAEAIKHTAPSKFPFETLENVVMSPHRAGHTSETERLRMGHLAELINTLVVSGQMPNRMDLTRGY